MYGMDKLYSNSYQSLVLFLVSTAHHLREVYQGPSHVVTLGLLMDFLVLDLVRSRIIKVSTFVYIY